MKKPNLKAIKWHATRRERQHRKTNWTKPHFISVVSADGQAVAKASKATPIPEVMCFDRSPEETLEELQRITRGREILLGRAVGKKVGKKSKHFRARRRRVGNYRPFEGVTYISTAAAIVMAASFEKLRLEIGYQPFVVNVRKWNPSVFSVLYDVGFFDTFGIPTQAAAQAKRNETEQFRLVPMISGETEDPQAVSDLVTGLMTLYPAEGAEDVGGKLHLYGALIEAIGNVVSHAYPTPFAQGSIRRWWMACSVDRVARRMTAVVFDQGVTIPVTLHKWARYAGWQTRLMTMIGLFPAPNDPRADGHAIAAALEESVSSTGDAHRGHGLHQMREFVNGCRDGYLRILSRRGQVIIRPRSVPEIKTFSAAVGGTLIEWNVQL